MEFGSKCLTGLQRWNPRGLGGPGVRQLPGNSGLTIFFQDDISTFVFPDDGWG